MAEKSFINEAIGESFRLYDEYNDKEETLEYNCFMCSVARMMVLIYGEQLLEYYKNNDEEKFDDLVLKYKYDESEYNNFKACFLKYYNFDKKIEEKAIKKKNKYFNLVQKYLIDMFIRRKTKDPVEEKVKNQFCDLIFSANSKTFYQKSEAVLQAYNPYEIYEYMKTMNLVGDGNEKDNNNK